MATITLNREAAAALVKEARRDFENGARELYHSDDEGQRPTIEACVEVIGVLAETVSSRWPREEVHGYTQDRFEIEVDLSPTALTWIDRNRESQVGYVGDLDRGVNGSETAGYIAEQVYLLHVLDGILGQREEVAA